MKRPSFTTWGSLQQGCAALLVSSTLSCVQVYADAAAVYAALADHLRGSAGKGGYFFGAKPSSLDAAMFAHLSLHHSAPVSAPELRQKVLLHGALSICLTSSDTPNVKQRRSRPAHHQRIFSILCL